MIPSKRCPCSIKRIGISARSKNTPSNAVIPRRVFELDSADPDINRIIRKFGYASYVYCSFPNRLIFSHIFLAIKRHRAHFLMK